MLVFPDVDVLPAMSLFILMSLCFYTDVAVCSRCVLGVTLLTNKLLFINVVVRRHMSLVILVSLCFIRVALSIVLL